jgi:hypothetical protein
MWLYDDDMHRITRHALDFPAFRIPENHLKSSSHGMSLADSFE